MKERKLGRRATPQQLKAFLDEGRVNYGRWKKPRTKTRQHLLKELRAGKCTLIFRNGMVYRLTHNVAAEVCWPLTDSVLHVLTEKSQVVGRGRKKRTRRRPANHSIKGKILPWQNPDTAIVTCLKKQLKLDAAHVMLTKSKRRSLFDVAKSFVKRRSPLNETFGIIKISDYPLDDPDPEGYPGLPTKRQIILYMVVVTDVLQKGIKLRYRHGGQITTYFTKPYSADSLHFLFFAPKPKDVKAN